MRCRRNALDSRLGGIDNCMKIKWNHYNPYPAPLVSLAGGCSMQLLKLKGG